MVLGHLPAAVPREREAHRRWQLGQIVGDRVPHCVRFVPVRERQDPHVAGAALDECRDRGRALAHHKVTFPMSDLRPLGHGSGPVMDRDHIPERPICCAIARADSPAAIPREISSRSLTVRYRALRCRGTGFTPPCFARKALTVDGLVLPGQDGSLKYVLVVHGERRGMGNMQAVVVDPEAPACLRLGEVKMPDPVPSEVLVRVSAISLNRGEVRRSQGAEEGFRPGWDLAGTVERAAADGTGPGEGVRVVGLLSSGAWAERVAVSTDSLAGLPENVSFEQAATLPVAGLTALYMLEKGGGLVGKSVLITGASGGVGLFALKLARIAGARVVALVRRKEHAGLVEEAGAHEVAVGEGARTASGLGPFDLILESVGGVVLGEALEILAPGGTCVAFGVSGGVEATFDVQSFYLTGGASLYGFALFHEVIARPAREGLGRLARLVAKGQLHPHISVEGSWGEIGNVAQSLLDRGYQGKAVLRVEE